MTLRLALPLLIAPAILIAGCGPRNGGLESVHQPVVQRMDYVFDVQSAGYGLAPAEQARLAGWMSSLGLKYGDFVYVDDPHGTGVRDNVQTEASRFGLIVAPTAPVTPGEVAPGTARIIVSRMSASVPGCPDYRRDRGPEFESSTSANFGCATNSNLAAMVANPRDLVRGQPGSPVSDPATSVRAIGARGRAAPTGQGGTNVPAAGNSGGNN